MSLLARRLCSRLASSGGRRSLATTSSLNAAKADQVTHTGQQFSASDPRNVRFAVTGLEKQVNDKWAIDLIKEVPPIAVNKRVVSTVPSPPVYLGLTVMIFRSPVTEGTEPLVTLESTSTWTTVKFTPASIVVSDMSSNLMMMISIEQILNNERSEPVYISPIHSEF